MSSFPKLFYKKRPSCLVNENWLALAGNLRPTSTGMRCYHKYLSLCHEQDPRRQKELYVKLCRGWYIGTSEGKESLLNDLTKGDTDRGPALVRFGKDGAEILLKKGLSRLGKTPQDLQTERKGAVWKVVLAGWIKSQCGISNQWLSETLHMGNMYNVSRMISQELKAPQTHKKLWRQLKSAKNKT